MHWERWSGGNIDAIIVTCPAPDTNGRWSYTPQSIDGRASITYTVTCG
jgi:hypothetical protein